MSSLNPQAVALNDALAACPTVLNLLSARGKAIYFPKLGILSQSAEAKGKRINATIGAGIDDDGTPMRLPSIANKIALPPGQVFPYAPSFGTPEIRAAWRQQLQAKNPSLPAHVSNPVVSCALTHGLSMIGYLFLNAGDEVIIADKYWENYDLTFELAYGAQLKFFPTFAGQGFNVAALAAALGGKIGKKVVVLNFPNNPTGYSPTKAEAQAIIALIRERAEAGDEILAVCDDAYFGLNYEDDVYPESLFAPLANLHERVLAVKADGPTKEDYVWGFRVGFITYGCKGMTPAVAAALENKTGGAIRGNISNAPMPSQSLLLQAFTSPAYAAEKQEKFALLKKRYLKVREVLRDAKYAQFFAPLPYNSGYFMCVELKGGLDPEQVRQKLLKDYDTAVIALGSVLRIAFSSAKERDIPALFENLFQACAALANK